MGQTKIILADPHPLFREGTRLLLSQNPDFEIIASVDSADAVPEILESTPARIVLMDVVMPGCSPIQTARLIRKRFIETRVAFLTAYADEEYLVEALDAGASGYILKESRVGDLTVALNEIEHGGTWVNPRMLSRLVQDYRNRGNAQALPLPRSATLTPREKEVLKLLAEGFRVKDVAANLKLSVKTIEAHKFNLMRKLDIHNKAQLVQYAFQKRIIPLHSFA
jgi:two-component system, NarL family, response regulator NreC